MSKPAEHGEYRNCGAKAPSWHGRWLAILALACASLPASAAPPIQVTQYSGRLNLDFAQAMQAWDNDIPVDGISLRPALPLRCHWDSDTRIACSPTDDGRFVDATRYDLRIAAGLKTQSGEVLPAQALTFETARPGLSASIDAWKAGMPDISISSNVATDKGEVKRVLRVSVDGKPVAFSVTPSPVARWRPDDSYFKLRLPDVGAGLHRLVVSAVPGLRSRAGPLRGIQDGALLSVMANEPFALRGVSCVGPAGDMHAEPRAGQVAITCPAGEPLWLELSRKPDEASLSQLQRSLPPGVQLRRNAYRPYRWQRESRYVASPSAFVALEMQDKGASAVLQLGAQFRSDDGAGLQPVRVELHGGDFQPSLRGRHADTLLANGSKPPALVEAFNAGDRRLQVRSLGVAARDGEVRSPADSDGKPRSLHSAGTERALAEGGWASWTPAGQGGRDSGADPIQFAAPAFDLHAVTGRRELLAWANAWKDGTPVAGARVELLHWDDAQAQPRKVASGITGDDGVAMLPLPDDFVLAGTDANEDEDEDADDGAVHGRWLVRAVGRDGSTRSVLPVEESSYSRSALGNPLERKVWGVSDRPIYHAGETVHYRLWQRDRRGARLVPIASAKPLRLRLRDEQRSKDILAWIAQPSADGSIAGELVLPAHLTDATYCIGARQGYDVGGACFYVGTYRTQDLWANASSPTSHVLRDGERFALDLEAGFYSGGPAAGLRVEEVASSLQPLPLQAAYPEYRDYEFVDTEDDDTIAPSLAGLDDLGLQLDAQGKAHVDLQATFDLDSGKEADLPAFAELYLNASVKPQERDPTTTNGVELRYARFDRYVGLRIVPSWFDATTPVRLAGIVIDAQGKRVPAAAIDVVIDYLPGFSDDAEPQRVAQCALRPGEESTCDFARKRSGRYRLTARSGDAAPAAVTRYVWAGGDAGSADMDEPELEILGPAGADGLSRRVMLKQPHAHARVLFVMRTGDAILGHLAARIDGAAQAFVLPIRRQGREAVSVNAIVCDAAPSPDEDGYRAAPDCDYIDDQRPVLDVDRGAVQPAVGVRFDREDAHPGDTVHVIVSNRTRQKRDVVLSVMDDALRAQASRWLPYADPLQGDWLDAVWRGSASLDFTGFEDWNGREWTWMLPWPQAPEQGTAESRCPQADPAGQAACEAQHAADAAAAGIAVPEPAVVFDEPSPMEVQAPPPAPLPPAIRADAAASSSLDRIEVTGSRISRADVEFDQGGAPPKGLRFDRERGRSMPRMPAGVRFRFTDTALWRPDLQLAPGETRSIEFKLPDNLTRWRAVAWSSDAGDDFAMSDAALETGLPVEVRLQSPVRLYPGDRARIAAHLRQSGDEATQAQVGFDVDGATAPPKKEANVALAAHGEGSVAMQLSPDQPGAVLVTASVQNKAGRDAVAAPIEIASPIIEGRKLQAGWLDDSPLLLDLPALPASATAPRLHLSLQRGASGLIDTWTQDLRDYPHRCWEQILSRAVAAALALERGDTQWPGARAVVQEALDNAAVFQDDEGGFRYFVDQFEDYGHESEPSVALTAYSVRALSLLKELGYQVDSWILESANDYLESNSALANRHGRDADASSERVDDAHAIDLAFAASEAKDIAPQALGLLWRRWTKLPLPAQLAAARALASHSDAEAGLAVRALVDKAPARGLSRTLSMMPGDDAWMGSDMQEQCSLIELLGEYPALADASVRRGLVRGLSDLYAGGTESVDTQTGASCLIALRDLARSDAEDAGSVRFGVGDRSLELRLPAKQRRDEGEIASTVGARLRIEPALRAGEPASYVAEMRYQEDARVARASAMGFAIDRRYEVFRDRAWVPVEKTTLREGDWIRITLVVDSGAPRHFVALTDSVPGGLRPTDLSLSGVGGLDLHKADGIGSGFFATRRLDARSPRFYAEYLPAGRHEVHYFALVGNSGDYLAAPAVAELMYGNAARARTAATRLVVPDREVGAGP